jgi:hypothetical protein
MATEMELFESPSRNLLDFYLLGWMKGQVNRRKVDTQDEWLARICDAAARIKKGEDQLRRTIRKLRTQVAKFTEFDGGIFEHLF